MKLDELRESIVLQEDIEEPALIEMRNVSTGIKLLLHHINNGGKIGVHFDIDCDGFAGGIVVYRCLKALLPVVCITSNKERVHGIMPEVSDFVWKNKLSLLIVVDAGSNLNYDVGCDVLVLDHHELGTESARLINGHRQIVINSCNTPNPEPMSGCEVAYEFFRLVYAQLDTQIDSTLAQWVGVSIISDMIDTKTPRNQFYVREAFESNKGINSDLRRICTDIDYYYKGVYKSYVTFKLAPYINAIARAGFSHTLAYIISDNESPNLPDWALAKRDEICKEAFIRCKRMGGVVFSNMSGIEDAWRYSGLAAAKLANETGRVALVFTQAADGSIKGSFRKGNVEAAYLTDAKQFLSLAEGHNPAFGFQCSQAEIKEYIIHLSKTAIGEPPTQLQSSDILGGKDLQTVALWNGRVTTQDELFIHIESSELEYVRAQGKKSIYKWRNKFEVELLMQEFPTPPRLFAEYQRGIGLYLK